ncbi:mfs monocarboxylate transporter [Diplodia corticola]|uniref:Mfs monocarboxylate transporter n=1 Tax=Diplodia corticola TaxID=236234 RepID=A0A1J9R3J4_9PEZI|nr:mfs monocarboxylate transporter [Diplodia corticola]OJD36006.1 mfs monocarboxylate transporter [Diplodia corticola]
MSDQQCVEAATPPQDSLSSVEDGVTNPTPSNVPSTVPPPPAPDGGVKAWSQAAAAHLVIFNCWGYISSFGLFQSYYTATFSVSGSAVSWIGSVQILLIYAVGTLSGRALDAGRFRPCVTAGCALQVLGVFATASATRYWHVFLAQGVCKGLGDGLVFCPAVALVATYFSARRSLAIGVMAAGGATGGVVFPLVARQLLPAVGFAWTVRVMGFVVLFNACVFSAVARVRVVKVAVRVESRRERKEGEEKKNTKTKTKTKKKEQRQRPRQRRPYVEWAAFAEPAYSLFCAAMFLVLWAVFIAYFYLDAYARDVVLRRAAAPSADADDDNNNNNNSSDAATTTLTLLLTLNAVGLPARLGCGFVADRLGPVNTLLPAVAAAGTLFFCWIAVQRSLGGLYAFAAVYGFFAGGIQSLFPAAAASLTADIDKMGVRTGMCFSVVSVACLTGPPIAGALIERADGGYLYAQVFGGVALMAGAATLVAARWARYGWDWRKKM